MVMRYLHLDKGDLGNDFDLRSQFWFLSATTLQISRLTPILWLEALQPLQLLEYQDSGDSAGW